MLVTVPLEKRHRELYGLQIKGVDCMAGAVKSCTGQQFEGRRRVVSVMSADLGKRHMVIKLPE